MNLKAGLERYIDWRDRAINEGLQNLKPDSGSTGPNHQDRWASHYQSRGSEAHTQLDNLAKSAEDAIQKFMLFVSTQESLFFRQLSQFTFARAAGEIKQTMRELENEANNLEGKWRELAGLDERADGEIATLRAQFLRELENAVAKLLGWSRKAEETARTIVAVGAEYDDKTEALENTVDSSPTPSHRLAQLWPKEWMWSQWCRPLLTCLCVRRRGCIKTRLLFTAISGSAHPYRRILCKDLSGGWKRVRLGLPGKQ